MTSEKMVYLKDCQGSEIRETLEGWLSSYPEMGILALLPESERGYVPALQDICAQREIPLVGAIFPGLVAKGGFCDRGILLLRLDERPFSAMYALNIPPDTLRDRIREISEDIKKNIDKPRDSSLFMIFDAMVPNIATILDNLYLELADAVHYMGVNAGSETFQSMPCLFDNKRVIQNGVLTVLLKHHSGAVLEHGYIAPERMIYATSTEGNRVVNIDWRPAFEVYKEFVKTEYGVDINRENFYQYSVCFPFGIVLASGEILVRIPVSLKEDGSIFCVGEVPPNSVLALLRAPAVDSLETVMRLTEGLASLNGPDEGLEILAFYCAGRRLYLCDKSEDEISELGRRTKALQIGGALSLGEIGSIKRRGYPFFHNATLVCSRWG